MPRFLLIVLALAAPAAATAPSLTENRANFAACASGPRTTCVVDGDTFWLDGRKIRIADINTPETSGAACPQEAELGRAAGARLRVLLNSGPFLLEAWKDGRDRDRYGRLLRVVTRRGESLGQTLVREGLAERWSGRRGSWC